MHPEDPDLPLHAMNPTGRFTERASDYARYRPDYPAAAWDAVLAGLGDPSALTAADVGAGTGISARALADRGLRVLAVEPNAAMREAAAKHPRVEWREGTAEATGLADVSVDLVVCAQAFHWFRHAEAVAEFHRVLRPGGRMALVWNSRDREDPLTVGYIEAIHAVNGEHPAEMRPFDPSVVPAAGTFTALELVTVPHVQRFDLEGFIGRATSASYVPNAGPGRATLEGLLRDVFERHRDASGLATMRYRTKVWLATRR